ncbi:hypothetical protein GCM10023078_35820 [Gibbsiella greigii]
MFIQRLGHARGLTDNLHVFRGVFRQRERRKGKAADGERQAAEPAFCRPRGVVSLCFHVFFPQSDDGELPVSRLLGKGC